MRAPAGVRRVGPGHARRGPRHVVDPGLRVLDVSRAHAGPRRPPRGPVHPPVGRVGQPHRGLRVVRGRARRRRTAAQRRGEREHDDGLTRISGRIRGRRAPYLPEKGTIWRK
ncbi:hypothetical protein FLW53_11935 [Microbispora sp. SCL1-1]|nr:hypothetical protein FLW53_11935 [Microbispora sp. SCL1-1]